VALEVTDLGSVKTAATELKGQEIDLLLHNAGIGGARGQTIGNIDYDAWAKVLDVNTMGPMRVCEAFVDNVARSERKLIVTTTSGMGSLADNTSGGSVVYRSSKAAVNMVMRSLATDFAPRGITCVVINHGRVRTDMGGPHATLTPAESVMKLRVLIETLGPGTDQRVLQLQQLQRSRIPLVDRQRGFLVTRARSTASGLRWLASIVRRMHVLRCLLFSSSAQEFSDHPRRGEAHPLESGRSTASYGFRSGPHGFSASMAAKCQKRTQQDFPQPAPGT
jgi:NAD(P)-dependent dehydrogenase (short-subunit alcohol dehydrogenase family)